MKNIQKEWHQKVGKSRESKWSGRCREEERSNQRERERERDNVNSHT